MLSIEEIRSYVVPVIEKYPVEYPMGLGATAEGGRCGMKKNAVWELCGNFQAETLRRKLAVVKSRYGKHYADFEWGVAILDMVRPMESGSDFYE